MPESPVSLIQKLENAKIQEPGHPEEFIRALNRAINIVRQHEADSMGDASTREDEADTSVKTSELIGSATSPATHTLIQEAKGLLSKANVGRDVMISPGGTVQFIQQAVAEEVIAELLACHNHLINAKHHEQSEMLDNEPLFHEICLHSDCAGNFRETTAIPSELVMKLIDKHRAEAEMESSTHVRMA